MQLTEYDVCGSLLEEMHVEIIAAEVIHTILMLDFLVSHHLFLSFLRRQYGRKQI